jgi:hypothetical protein
VKANPGKPINYRCCWERWWAMTGSNRRHSRCKRDALPTELIAPRGWTSDAKARRLGQAKRVGVHGFCKSAPLVAAIYPRIATLARSDRTMKARRQSSRSGRHSTNPVSVIRARSSAAHSSARPRRRCPGSKPKRSLARLVPGHRVQWHYIAPGKAPLNLSTGSRTASARVSMVAFTTSA